MTKKRLFITLLIAIYSTLLGSEVTKYIRYVYQGQESYGILEGEDCTRVGRGYFLCADS